MWINKEHWDFELAWIKKRQLQWLNNDYEKSYDVDSPFENVVVKVKYKGEEYACRNKYTGICYYFNDPEDNDYYTSSDKEVKGEYGFVRYMRGMDY